MSDWLTPPLGPTGLRAYDPLKGDESLDVPTPEPTPLGRVMQWLTNTQQGDPRIQQNVVVGPGRARLERLMAPRLFNVLDQSPKAVYAHPTSQAVDEAMDELRWLGGTTRLTGGNPSFSDYFPQFKNPRIVASQYNPDVEIALSSPNRFRHYGASPSHTATHEGVHGAIDLRPDVDRGLLPIEQSRNIVNRMIGIDPSWEYQLQRMSMNPRPLDNTIRELAVDMLARRAYGLTSPTPYWLRTMPSTWVPSRTPWWNP